MVRSYPVRMTWYRSLACIASLCVLTVACGDGTDGAPSGDGGTDSGGGSGAGTSGGGSGSGTGSDGGSTSGGGTGAGGSGGGDTNGDLDELFVDALEECTHRALGARVQYADRDLANLLESSLTSSTTTTAGSDETIEVETILGHTMRLTWPASAQPGDHVAVSGFFHDEDGAESRNRCFEGELDVRVDVGLDGLYFVFASTTLFEATADGTCGAPTTDEVTLGCLSEDFE